MIWFLFGSSLFKCQKFITFSVVNSYWAFTQLYLLLDTEHCIFTSIVRNSKRSCFLIKSHFLQNSRLHFIGTWRNRYRKRFPSLSNEFKCSDTSASATSEKNAVIHVDMVLFTFRMGSNGHWFYFFLLRKVVHPCIIISGLFLCLRDHKEQSWITG